MVLLIPHNVILDPTYAKRMCGRGCGRSDLDPTWRGAKTMSFSMSIIVMRSPRTIAVRVARLVQGYAGQVEVRVRNRANCGARSDALSDPSSAEVTPAR